MANASITTVQFVYKRVIDETIKNSRETFLNEGIEESVLQELRTLWESKVSATRAVEPAMNPPDYIPRGQIYKYNYRNQPPNTVQATAVGGSVANVPFPGHISAFIPQTIQGQTISPRPQPIQGQTIAPRPQPIQGQTIALRPQPLAARPTNTHNPVQGNAPSSSGSQYPSNIPFPSLSAVTTVTKKEFNNASDSIQVDGACDVIDDVTATSRDTSQIHSFKEVETGDIVLRQKMDRSPGTCCGISIPKRKHKRVRERSVVLQLDGGGESDDDVGEFVDSEESEEDEENDDTDEEIDVGGERNSNFDLPDDLNRPSTPVEEDDPLNSGDDDSDDGSTEFEATDNVVVCLFDKITRSKNKWKLYLKEGVMNIGGKDHVFHKAIGDGEW